MDRIKKSILDFVIVSSDMIKDIEQIHIDDERVHVLTKNLKTKNGIHYSESDHHIINTKFKLTWTPSKSKVVEVFMYKNKDSKEKFKKLTSETKQLSQIVDMKKPLDIVTRKFLKRLKGFIHESFNKVKIVETANKELEHLYDKRRALRNQQGLNP